jgi:Peptidase family M48
MKMIIGVVLAALYLAAIGWAVRREGVAYRHGLRERRKATVDAAPIPPAAITEPHLSTPSPPPISSPGPVDNPASLRPDQRLTSPVGPVPFPSKTGDSAPRPGPEKKTGGEHASQQSDKLAVAPLPPDLRGLAPEARNELGDELHRLIIADLTLRDEPALTKRLEYLCKQLAASRTQVPEPIRFHVLESDGVNAFSHIGGHIYLSRGVFALAQVDAELQFVIAHELAHLELGHAPTRLEQLAREAIGGIGLLPGLSFLLAMGYSAEQELEADVWAYQALRRAGRSHRQAVGFPRRYAGYADEHNLSAGRRSPKSRPGESRQDIENHYPAHPPARERLKRLEGRTGSANAGRAPSGSPR